jgi:hypothetical protein
MYIGVPAVLIVGIRIIHSILAIFHTFKALRKYSKSISKIELLDTNFTIL